MAMSDASILFRTPPFIIVTIVAILRYYSSINAIVAERLSDNENVVTNTAYFFAALIPYIFLWKKNKKFAFVSLILLLYFIIGSSKRGALLVGLYGSFVFICYHLSTVEPKKRFQNYSSVLIGMFISIYILYKFYINNTFLTSRLEDLGEGGSGRDVIYSDLWGNWLNSSSIFNQIFGFGFMSTPQYNSMGQLAHNDWLEILTNFGVIGVIIYLILILILFSFVLNNRIEKELRIIIFLLVSTWILITVFSMYFTSINTLFSSILIGHTLGMQSASRKKYRYYCSKRNNILSKSSLL